MVNPNRYASKIGLTLLICMVISLSFVYTVSAQTTVVSAEASSSQPQVGDTLTVNIKISNAQNLYGLDVTLDWNPQVLQLVTATPQLGVESHSGGVLHESSTYPIDIATNSASQDTAEYHLVATSQGASTPAFTGSGTIATVTFTVKSTGQTGLALSDVELSVQSSGKMNLVTPATTVTAVNPNSTVTSTPGASPTVPEYPALTLVIVALIAVVAVSVSTKLLKNKAPK
jgi:hypothetical protein